MGALDLCTIVVLECGNETVKSTGNQIFSLAMHLQFVIGVVANGKNIDSGELGKKFVCVSDMLSNEFTYFGQCMAFMEFLILV